MNERQVPWAINDLFQDGFDFADAVNEIRRETRQTSVKTAGLYLREFGELPDGYTMDNFRYIDGRELIIRAR